MTLQDVIATLKTFKTANPRANKAAVESYFQSQTKAAKGRSVYLGKEWAFRFCEANFGSFSNVVLSLAAAHKYDSVPLVICIVRPDRLDFRLANTTFLRQISHSSHSFTETNIKGSFLGHDIIQSYEKIPNEPEQFSSLFAIHEQMNWNENVKRLAAATSAITPRLAKITITPEMSAMILQAPARAKSIADSPFYRTSEQSLYEGVTKNKTKILTIAGLENVNLRGNEIEQIVTGAIGRHRLDDLVFQSGRTRLIVDIKTKLLDRNSAPKAYNVDKLLILLSEPDTDYLFLFIGINVPKNLVTPRLISLFDKKIITATKIQHHWAGKASRGVTQLSGDLSDIFQPSYKSEINIDSAKSLLQLLMER